MDSDSEPSTTKKTFKCTKPGCGASFSKNRKLISHTRIHTGERPFICNEPDCTKTYTNSSHLIRHKKVAHGEKLSQKVICGFEGCGLELSNKYSLKKHYNRKHNPELYSFKCNECSRGFHRKKELQQHVYLHTGAEPFSCDKCCMSFTTNYKLNKHQRSHRIYHCDCGEMFHRWSLLLAHKKQCKKKEYVCNICDKVFSHAGNFKNHSLVHKNTSEKLVFVCPYSECKRYYFYKRNLKYHIDNFHKKINQNQVFKCTYPKCQVLLKTKQSLKMHLQRHFKFTEKKKRQTRRDKGKPKKKMVSVLSGEDSQIRDVENLNDNAKQHGVDNVESIQISIDKTITTDDLLEQCEATLRLLNEKIISAT